MPGLFDSIGRPINYLRLSITDRCNLRCRYCFPEKGIKLSSRNDLLSFEELVTVAKIAAELGITKIRLTGGEPLVRKDLIKLVEMLARINSVDDLSLTTNGVLLHYQAKELKQAGLTRINISLDSLKPDKFHYITRHDKLKEVLKGIEAAQTASLNPVKINMVVLRGINDDEIINFAHRTITHGWHVRFIELMPFAPALYPNHFMPAFEIKERLLSFDNLEPSFSPPGSGPARYFRFPGAKGTIGFITPITEHFCISCNRLRLTAEGKLYTCLLSDKWTDLRPALRKGVSSLVKRLIQEAVQNKPHHHSLTKSSQVPTNIVMSQLGG